MQMGAKKRRRKKEEFRNSLLGQEYADVKGTDSVLCVIVLLLPFLLT